VSRALTDEVQFFFDEMETGTMKISRILLATFAVISLGSTGFACEHCRAAAAAAAMEQAIKASPTDLAVTAIRTAGEELRQSVTARRNLCEESARLQAAREQRQRELETIGSQLLALKAHVQSNQYPVVLGEVIIREETTARRLAAELLSRHDSLTEAIADMGSELEAGEQDLLQLNRRIHERETDILLAKHRATRLQGAAVPTAAARPLAAIRQLAPSGSPRAVRTQRLNEFLANGVQSAATTAEATVR